MDRLRPNMFDEKCVMPLARNTGVIAKHIDVVRDSKVGPRALTVTLFFFNDTATTEIYTLSLHDALPIYMLKLTTLQQAFPGLVVGFSDHTQGATAAALAAALGARIFEKHFTLDHDLPGPDHWFSEDPAGLTHWVRTIREAVTMLGSPLVEPTTAELGMRVLARRSIVALRDIEPGEPLDETSIGLRRPGGGLPPAMFDKMLGLIACRAIKRGQKIALKDAKS